MKLIRSLIGRRQFLLGAFATSTLGLLSKRVASAFTPGSESGIAMASGMTATAGRAGAFEKTAAPGLKENADNRYFHLLSPLKIRNKLLKNRMMYTVSIPHWLQGPETFPTDVVRSYYARVAKSAAIVTCRIRGDAQPREEIYGNGAHMMQFDTSDPAVQNYMDQMVEGVHCMGSLVSGGNLGGAPMAFGASGPAEPVKMEDLITQAKTLEDQGVDVVSMMGAGNLKDKKAVDTAIEQMQAVRNATDLIIMMSMTIIEPSVRPETCDRSGGTLIEDAIETAKTFEESADILFFKAFTGMTNHPTGFNQRKGDPVVLRIAKALKESGTKIILAPNGGFRDPDLNEAYISSGKTDIVAMARAFICDWEYGKKIYEGRGEDTVPCIMCEKCHGTYYTGPWFSVCSVNPKLGIAPAVRILDTPSTPKKVAVIGGGPAGMKAAITAAERGHNVTLYEKTGYLGGLLRHADFSPYKWPLKDYKDHLVRQTYKAGVEVLLDTAATPDMIRADGYDTVLAAIGSEPVMPRIPGAGNSNIWNVANVYGEEKKLGKNVVVIGGGEFGTETGMYLANAGHKVMVLTSAKELLRIDSPHRQELVIDAYEYLDGFDFIVEAVATGISGGKVAYLNAEGAKKTIKADSVVIYAGLKPKLDEALKFYGTGGKSFFTIGDCSGKCGNVQKSIRNAFFMASQI